MEKVHKNNKTSCIQNYWNGSTTLFTVGTTLYQNIPWMRSDACSSVGFFYHQKANLVKKCQLTLVLVNCSYSKLFWAQIGRGKAQTSGQWRITDWEGKFLPLLKISQSSVWSLAGPRSGESPSPRGCGLCNIALPLMLFKFTRATSKGRSLTVGIPG